VIRNRGLEKSVFTAVTTAPLASTTEVTRIVNRLGTSVGRAAVRRTLRVLEDEGQIANIGDGADAWRVSA